jgi:hypothetical protein
VDKVLGRWFGRAAKTLIGQIFLSNLIFDVHHSRIPPDILRDVLRKLGTELHVAGAKATPLSAMNAVVDSAPHQFLCRGPKIRSTAAPEQLSRVVDFGSLERRNLSLRRVGGSPAVRGVKVDKLVEDLQRFGLKGKTRGEMRGYRPFAWVTTTESITDLRRSFGGSDLASEVRNQAGLRHLWKDNTEWLVEITYPPNTYAYATLAAPTFLEGSPSRVFRCTYSSDGWGRAVDLRTYNDSMVEAVHLPVPFTDEFELASIGRLTTILPTYDKEAFEVSLPDPWNSGSLMELDAYVGLS